MIAGSQDAIIPTHEVHAMADGIPGARYVELDCGHLSNLERPRAVNEQLAEFLVPARMALMSQLPKDLLDILACPRCRGPLAVEPASLRCDACMLRYRVDNGIPVMLIHEAEHLGPDTRRTRRQGPSGQLGRIRRGRRPPRSQPTTGAAQKPS